MDIRNKTVCFTGHRKIPTRNTVLKLKTVYTYIKLILVLPSEFPSSFFYIYAFVYIDFMQ